MSKAWDQMTQPEKIEELRRDLLNTMATVNSWITSQQQLGAFHNDLMHKHSATAQLTGEVAKVVEVLEKKVAKLEK